MCKGICALAGVQIRMEGQARLQPTMAMCFPVMTSLLNRTGRTVSIGREATIGITTALAHDNPESCSFSAAESRETGKAC